MGIFAQKDIQENEELTFDYQFDFFKTAFTKCYCGTAKCKGFLGVARNTADNDSSSSAEISDEEVLDSQSGNVSEHERIRLDREKAILASSVNHESP